jgi:O-antigen ligase
MKILNRVLILGIPLISCFAFTLGTDPVNLPKLLILSTVAGSVLFLLIVLLKNKLINLSKEVIIFFILFVMASLIPVIFTDAPMAQQLYGDYSRNTGLLFYLSVAVILVGATLIKSKQAFFGILVGLAVTSLFNMAVSIPELFGYEILKYNNTFGRILGAFGNPNFIGAFFAFSSSVPLVVILNREVGFWKRLIALSYLILSLFMIIESNARQGLIVFALIMFLGFLIYAKTSPGLKMAKRVTLLIFTPVLIVASFGTVGYGPLTNMLYKTSVTLRGEYWLAGLNMFKSHFLTGVGLNSYGDWYRSARRAEALILPGIDTTTNASHNVIIDYAATGGIFFVTAYLLLIAFTCISIWKVYSKLAKFDPIWSGLTLAWVGYQVQSFVSIDQIGLAIWGWALSGVLIAYASFESNAELPTSKSLKRKNKGNLQKTGFTDLVAVFGLVFGFGLCLPAYLADTDWKSEIQRPSQVGILEKAQKWPIVEDRILEGAIAFSDNKLYDSSLILVKRITQENPRSYVGWKMLYENPKSSKGEKSEALKNLLSLDPLNPQLLALTR